MDFESVGPYSPSTVYGELTSPFTPKLVKINAHPSYDEEIAKKNEAAKKSASKNNNVKETTEEIFSRSDFRGKHITKYVYSDISNEKIFREEITNKKLSDRKNDSNLNINDKKEENDIPLPDILSFSSSKLSDDSNSILRDALKKGYNTSESIVIQKAYNAYKKSATLTKNPVGTLGSCAYEVF